jgi:hypothetical protein
MLPLVVGQTLVKLLDAVRQLHDPMALNRWKVITKEEPGYALGRAKQSRVHLDMVEQGEVGFSILQRLDDFAYKDCAVLSAGISSQGAV